MDLSTAYRILGVEKSVSLAEIEFARQKLLQVLHPDKHPPPPEQREIFGKMTHDVVEPAELLRRSGSVRESKSENATNIILEDILFDVRAPHSHSQGLVHYGKRYAK